MVGLLRISLFSRNASNDSVNWRQHEFVWFKRVFSSRLKLCECLI
jgi:hypothetical protein